MKRRFTRHKNRQDVDVDITSLLDILTILLVFLLQSYNASDLQLDIVKNLEVPDSEARDLTRFAPVVQIDKTGNVYLDNKEIGRLPASGSFTQLTHKLKETKAMKEEEAKFRTVKPNTELLNLVFDRDMEYENVQKVMHDSALAGYSQFKFIVKGSY